MVAVVSGNGLGLFNTSLTQLGSALGGQSGIGQSRDSQYLNIATGNLLLSGWDESLFGRNLSTSLVRTYNSAGNFATAGNDGWQSGYERTVQLSSGTLNAPSSTVQRTTADGAIVSYLWNATRNAYVSSVGDGAHDTITMTGTGSASRWLWTEGSSQVQETYAAGLTPTVAGRLEQITDLATGAAYSLTYNTSNQLTVITGAAGETLEFTYQSTSGPLIAVSTRERDATGTLVLKGQVTYGYDTANRLSWVQTDLTPDNATDNTWDGVTAANNDNKRFRSTYTYADSTSFRITGVTTSDGVSISYTYDGSGRVQTLTQGNASDGSAQTLTYTYSAGATDVSDSAGRTWTYQFDGNGQLTAVLEPAVSGLRQVTSYTYDIDGNVTRISQAGYAGAAATLDTVFKYDAYGNVILQRDRLGDTIERTYNAANRVLTEVSYTTPDADGLDPTFIGNTNLPSGALVTRYVYDTTNLNQLRFVLNAAGEVSENQYNASGTAIGQLSMSRRFVGTAYDISGLANTAVPTLAQMTSWIVGKESQSTRAEVSYDAQGRIKQTVAYATVDGAGLGVLDAAAGITNYTYDAQGLLRQKIAVYGASRTLAGVAPTGSAVTDYLYDGLGRLLGVVSRDVATASNDDANTVATTYSYLDAANQLQVTLDSGAVRLEARNKAGMLVSVSESGLVSGATVTRTTQNFYDGTGRLRGSQDDIGVRSYYFYDADGRLSATVDGTGAVTETRYDSIGRVTQSVSYAMRVDTTSWLVGGVVSKDTLVYADTVPSLLAGQAWVDTDAANDRNAYRTYDAAGRLATETDAAGLVTTYAYDGASRLLSTTVSKPGDGTVIPRVTRYFYDAASRQVGTLDAAGYLTESVFDAGGRVIKTVRYATLTNSTYWATGTLAQLRPTTAAADQNTRVFYDARGQQLGVLDAEGYLTEYVTDEAANQRAVKEYAKQLTGLTGTETFTALRTAALTSPPTEALRLTQRSFNGLGQLTTELNAEGTVTKYTYDEAGRLVRTESAQGTSEVRENFSRYDVFGQLIGEISGEQAVAATATLGGKLINDPTLTDAQLDTIYTNYGTRHSYDLRGQRIESTDAKSLNPLDINTQGNKTWYFYDADGRNTFTVRGVVNGAGLKNALGEVTETRYSAFGQVTDTLVYTGRIAIGGTQTRADAQAAINVLTYVAASDTRRQFTYDQRGLLATSLDAETALTQYTHTAFGQLSQQQRGVGTAALTTTQYSYDIRGLQTGRTDGVGSTVVRSVSQAYDAFGRVINATDARGTISSFSYDRLGRQLGQSETVDGRLEVTSATYDAFDRVLTQTDALGKITSYVHSDSARSMKVTTPEGVAITTVHNRFGQTVTVSQVLADATTAVTTYTYDKNGALISTVDATGNTATNTYDVRGLLATSTDASGRQVAYTYDAIGRALSRIEDQGTGKLNLTTTTSYDGQGRQLTVTDASGRVTAMSYDREGRLLQTAQDPSGLNLRTAYTYDVLGRQITVTEAFGTATARSVNYVYDVLGRRTSETVDPGAGHLNLTTSYVYDANDNVVTRTDAGGNLTRYSYDEANRLRFSVDALGGITESSYDKNGRATITRSYAKAAVITGLATAPTLAQVRSLIAGPPSLVNDAVDSVSYRVYDNDGRLRFSIDALYGVQENIYDSASRLTATRSYAKAIVDATLIGKIKAGTAVVADFTGTTLVADDTRDTRSFAVQDAAGRVRFTVDGSGFINELRYDAAGRVIERLAYATASATLLASAKAGTATVAAFASFVTANAAAARASSTVFDAAGRVAYTLTRSDPTQAVVSERRYDASGHVIADVAYGKTIAYASGQTVAQMATAITNAGGNAANAQRLTQYVYDAGGRLRYSLDDSGVVSEQRFNAQGQVIATVVYGVAISTSNPTEASVTSALTGATNLRLTSYTYDNAGRLASTTDALTKTETYGYDAMGRRTSFTSKAGFTWTTQYNALGQVVAEFSPTVQVARYNSAGALVVESKSIVTRMVYDALGNLTSRTENADTAEARTTQYVYDARGRQIKTIFPDAYVLNASNVLVATGVLPEVNVTYDALDRAVVQKDVRNNYSYKAYNLLGQLAYDVDADGYVTAYSYDAYGEQTGLTRYATKFNITQPGQALTAAQVQAGIVANASADRVLTMTYDARGNKIAVTQPTISYYKADGTATTGTPRSEFTYDAYNNLVKQSVLIEGTAGQSDAVWANTFNYYNDLGQCTLSVDAEGYVTAWQYSAFGQMTEQLQFARAISTTGLTTTTPPTLPAVGDAATGYDRGTSYVYDGLGRKLSESVLRLYQNADGTTAVTDVETDLEYDNADHVTATTVAGNRTETDYDALGHTTAVTEQARLVLAANWQTLVANSNLNDLNTASLYVSASPYTAMIYDAFGNTIQVTRSGLGERNGVVTASATDQISTTMYDRQGRAVLSTDPAGKVVAVTYDAADNVIGQSYKLIDRDGHNATIVSSYTYDASNRQTTQTTVRMLYAGGQVTDSAQTVAYNAFGEITAKADVTGDLGIVTKSAQYEYDVAGHILRSNAEGGTYRRYGYNLAGVQVREERDWTDAGVNKIAVYTQSMDKLGRVIKVVSPSYTSDSTATATTTLRLDRWGNVLEQIDARGFNTQSFYNDQNKLIRQLAPLVKVVSEAGVETWQRPETLWRYDSLGRLIAEVDANGHKHTYVYDVANRLTSSDDALLSTTVTGYDALGQVLASENEVGHITYVDHDVAGRATGQGDFLLGVSGSTRTKASSQTFTLDQDGNRLTVTDALNDVQLYNYDSRGKLTRSQTATGEVVSYTYDLQGRKLTETHAGGSLAWTYDYYGRTATHTDMSGVVFTYSYDARSGLQTTIAQPGNSRNLTYFANGQVRSIAEGTNLYTYAYDAVGNRTLEETTTVDGGGQTVHVVTQTYYDSLNRISRVTSDDAVFNVRMLDVTYDYDAVGNRRRVTADSSYGPGAAPVSTADRAPIVIATPATQTVVAAVAKTWTLRASDIFRDPENTAMTYTVTKGDGTALPSWLTVTYDSATGLLTFNTTAASVVGTTSLKITARDLNGAGQTVAATFNLTVFTNHAPIVANTIANQSLPAGATWNFTFAANTFTDSDGQTLTYTATGLPAGVLFDGATRTFRGSPDFPGTTYPITVTASDGTLSVSTTFNLVVSGPNTAPILVNAIPNQTTAPSFSSNWSYTIPANTFSDTDALTITQNGMPSWMSFNSATQTFSGPGRVYGSSTITVTATDSGGLSVSTTFVVTVPNVGPVLVSAIPNQTVSANVAMSYAFPSTTFDDANTGQTLTYSATGMPAWMTFTPGSRLFTGTPPSAGSWTLTVTATDPLGAAVSTQFTITSVVNNAPVVANAVPDQNAIRQQAFTYTFPANTFSDPNGDTLTYSYGTVVGQAAWLSFNAATRTFSGTPLNISNDVTIRLTATDTGGLSVYDDFIIHVTAAGGGGNQAPVVANPVPDQNAVRQQAFTYTFPANTFSDPNGDTLTYSYTKVVGTAAWLSFNAATRTFSGTPANIANDVTIRLTATDAGGLSTYDDFIIHVAAAGGGSQAMQASRTQMQADTMSSSQTTSTQTMAATNPTQPGTTPNHQVLWFTYDFENRVQVINGTMNNGVIMVGGYGSWAQQYDIVGNVTSKTTLDTSDGTTYVALSEYDLRGEVTKTYYQTAVGQPSNGVETVSTYDAAGHLSQTTRFFGNNDMRSVWIDTIDQYDNPWSGYVPLNVGGWLYNRVTYTYDADGRLKTQQTDGRALNWTDQFAQYGRGTPTPRVVVPTDVVAAEKDPLGALTALSTLAYTTSTGASGYDSSGRLITHRYLHLADGESGDLPHGAFTTTFTHTYVAKESFLETVVAADVDVANFRDGHTDSTYDAWGRRTVVTDTTPLKDYATTITNQRFFSYDGQAGILTRRDGSLVNGVFTQTVDGYSPGLNPAPDYITNAQWTAMTEADRQSWLSKSLNQHFVYSNGQQVGQLNEAGRMDVADKLTAFDSSNIGSTLVAVNDGDTLHSVAQRVYGNASLWYVLADANAVSDTGLVTGQMLKVPQITTNKNNATTFKPYNPADVIGPTEPGTPYITKAPGLHCQALSAVIQLVVTALVTYWSGGNIAAGAAAGDAAGQASSAMLNGQFDWVGFLKGNMNPFDHTATDLMAANPWLAAAAIGGNNQQHREWANPLEYGMKYDYKRTAISIAAAYASYGASTFVGNAVGSAVAGSMAGAAAGYVTNYELNRAAGRDVHFSLRSMGASMVAQGIIQGVFGNTSVPVQAADGTTIPSGAMVPPPAPFSWTAVAMQVLQNLAGAGINYAVHRAFGDKDFHWNTGMALADAFGNAFGNVLVGAIKYGKSDHSVPPVAVAQPDDSSYQSSGILSSLDSDHPWFKAASSSGSGGLTLLPQMTIAQGTVGPTFVSDSLAESPDPYLRALQQQKFSDAERADLNTYREKLVNDGVYFPGDISLGELNYRRQSEGFYAPTLGTVTVRGSGATADSDRNLRDDGIGIGIYRQDVIQSYTNKNGELPHSLMDRQRAERLVDAQHKAFRRQDDALLLKSAGVVMLAGITGPIIAGSTILTAAASGISIGMGANDLKRGNYIQGSLEVLGGTLGAYAAGMNSLRSATAMGDVWNAETAIGSSTVAELQAFNGVRRLQAGVPNYAEMQWSYVPSVANSAPANLIGKSGYASVQEFSDAAYVQYQGFVDQGYTLAKQEWDAGRLVAPGLRVSKNTVLGSYTDRFARESMNLWLEGEGIAQGEGELIQINSYLRDPSNPNAYRIPDINVPGANQIYDATLETKSWATPQVRGFFDYSRGSNITIVRPTQLGGSYSVLPPW
jgi:YD repeat-containing protein